MLQDVSYSFTQDDIAEVKAAVEAAEAKELKVNYLHRLFACAVSSGLSNAGMQPYGLYPGLVAWGKYSTK